MSQIIYCVGSSGARLHSVRLPGRYSSLLRMGLLGRRNLLDLPKLRFPTRAGLLPKGSVFPIDRVPFPHDPRMAGEPGGRAYRDKA
jgi:hypothetical protein